MLWVWDTGMLPDRFDAFHVLWTVALQLTETISAHWRWIIRTMSGQFGGIANATGTIYFTASPAIALNGRGNCVPQDVFIGLTGIFCLQKSYRNRIVTFLLN